MELLSILTPFYISSARYVVMRYHKVLIITYMLKQLVGGQTAIRYLANHLLIRDVNYLKYFLILPRGLGSRCV